MPDDRSTGFRQYRRTAIAEMADWHPEFDMTGVSVSEADRKAGSPKLGDKIARNPKNHDDKWLVAATYFADNFKLLRECGERCVNGGTNHCGKLPGHEQLEGRGQLHECDTCMSIGNPYAV